MARTKKRRPPAARKRVSLAKAEVMSLNVELRAANVKLQSVNERLVTGSHRLKDRVAELEQKIAHRADHREAISSRNKVAAPMLTARVRDTTAQLALHEEIVRIAMQEQRRIGQELHDGTQQELTGLSLLAKSLAKALAAHGTSRDAEVAAKLAAGITEANWHVHTLARGLVPVPVDACGLMAALGELARGVAEREGPRCRFECPAPVEVNDDVVATHLYRIAQEAVTNAVKHSRAAQICIRLNDDAGQVELAISDNGTGIDPRKGQGLGMRTMEHRRALIGGVLKVRGKRGGGTVVTCTLPKGSPLNSPAATSVALP